jgi:hypothetical protein
MLSVLILPYDVPSVVVMNVVIINVVAPFSGSFEGSE